MLLEARKRSKSGEYLAMNRVRPDRMCGAMDRKDRRLRIVLLGAVACLSLAFACNGEDDSVAAPTFSAFRGVLSESTGRSGMLLVEVHGGAATKVAAVSGSLTIDGARVSLTGTFDAVSGSLITSGGAYRLHGTVRNSRLRGDSTGPGGSSGAFAALGGDRGVVTVFCGRLRRDDKGVLGIVTDPKNGALITVATAARGVLAISEGRFVGDDVAFVTGDLVLKGRASGETLAGTWESESANQSGDWTAGRCAPD